ncbi:tetratricopeptide repeat protein [Mesorhizobium koreense]|uniref:tetratricopeptide repeat protein n=1 Tax=Mesorhizobium koreense TaxID=3074855 RepID=UPI00287B8E85|nr:tetratricopeptide repeat protein [Mesorhizobium sp. WR6]
MRGLFVLLSLTLFAAPAVAADNAVTEPTPSVKQLPTTPVAAPKAGNPLESAHAKRLDKLFSELKRERNEHVADRISRQIWQQWLDSGSATVDLLMQWANDAIQTKKYPVALDFLDQIIALDPSYAEGWNRRATVHYMMGDYTMSMADIDKTLQLEPRHFGALAGMAEILKDTGRKELALKAYERALQVYPMMRSAQSAVETLTQDLAGQDI